MGKLENPSTLIFRFYRRSLEWKRIQLWKPISAWLVPEYKSQSVFSIDLQFHDVLQPFLHPRCNEIELQDWLTSIQGRRHFGRRRRRHRRGAVSALAQRRRRRRRRGSGAAAADADATATAAIRRRRRRRRPVLRTVRRSDADAGAQRRRLRRRLRRRVLLHQVRWRWSDHLRRRRVCHRQDMENRSPTCCCRIVSHSTAHDDVEICSLFVGRRFRFVWAATRFVCWNEIKVFPNYQKNLPFTKQVLNFSWCSY